MEPREFTEMVGMVHAVWKGVYSNKASEVEQSSRQFRRSLYAVEDIEKGHVFTERNVRSIRPGYGLPPMELPSVLGMTAKVAIKRGTALRHRMIGSGIKDNLRIIG